MASPTSWVVSSALPVARTASSTRWPSWASASSVTGRPWHALRTPLMTLVRLKGSVTPDRLTTISEHVSTVVKRREQSGHWRRLRIDVPSSVVRLSTTRLSGCLQKGQCMAPTLLHSTTHRPLETSRAPRSSPKHRRWPQARRPGGPQHLGCCCNPTTRCGDRREEWPTSRVSHAYWHVPHGHTNPGHTAIPWWPCRLGGSVPG